MPFKTSSLKTNTSKKATDNIRGIGEMYNQFPSTFEYGIAKLLDKILRSPTMDMLSQARMSSTSYTG